MAADDVAVVNRSFVQVGEELLVDALSENPKAEAIYAAERDALLAMHPWGFALKRTRLTAAGLLDCSSKVITFVVNTGADTITDDGNGFVTNNFETGDIAYVVDSGDNTGNWEIATVVAGTLTLESQFDVTAEALTNDADLKIYALNAKGQYKYALPSNCLSVYRVNEVSLYDQPTYWIREGKFIVSADRNQYDQLPIQYIKQVTDTTLFPDYFEECLVIRLNAAFAMAYKENAEQAKQWNKHFDYKFKQACVRNVRESNPDKTRRDTNWQSAGR